MRKQKSDSRESAAQVRLPGEHNNGADCQNPPQGRNAPAGDTAAPSDAETRVQELNRLLLAIREVNKFIVRERDPQQLLAKTCALLVETRSYALAWIGLTQPDSKRVVPTAVAGKQAGYVEGVSATWDETPAGQGPVGAAIRTQRPWLCLDTATDPRFSLWRESALARGLASLAAVPMIQGGRVFGALAVYSSRPGSLPRGGGWAAERGCR